MSDDLLPPDSARRYKGNEKRSAETEPNLPQAWEPRQRGCFGGMGRILFLLIVLALLLLPFTPYAGKIKRSINDMVDRARETKVVYRDVPQKVLETREVIKEVIKEIPAAPPPLPANFIPRKEVDVATLYNGITIESELDAQPGNYASVERLDKGSYTVEFKLKIRVPKANDTLVELARVNDNLPKILPGLESMMTGAKVSGFYHKLYENKTANVQRSITRLNKALDKHNFFDCETILELTHPQTQRKVLLIQSEMDVVADGSDGDRMAVMSADIYDSDYYQPFTSYEWAKTGKTTNPLLSRWQARLETLKKEYGQKGLSSARNAELKAGVQEAERIISSLKSRSSLIAEKDPFIVLSLLFREYSKSKAHGPAMGDYAAVIHEGKIYPAICGDYGPSFKMGEASLMMAKAINPKATPYIRPESDLKVSYVIFPGTAEKPFGAPDLDKWHEKVATYLKECGGLGEGYTLHKWENPFPKPPEPVVPAPVTPAPATSTPTPEVPATPTTTPAPGAPPVTVKPAEPAPVK